jgi:pyruvyltransferase
MFRVILSLFLIVQSFVLAEEVYLEGLPLYYWQTSKFINFGDYLSLKMVERIVGGQVRVCHCKDNEQKLLAIGSVLTCGRTGDVLWGTGMNGKVMDPAKFKFTMLDIRAIRGPKTREFVMSHFQIPCPEIYGDPALLLPYLFPEFVKPVEPEFDYVIVPHYSEIDLYPLWLYPNVVYPTDPWRDVIRKILNSRFVISSSLHGIVVAEAYGIPARYLRISDHEPIYKYIDYYEGTQRPHFQFATTIEEALIMGGEPPFKCDLKALYESFPFDYWPTAEFHPPIF